MFLLVKIFQNFDIAFLVLFFLRQALCINSVDQRQAALASNKKVSCHPHI